MAKTKPSLKSAPKTAPSAPAPVKKTRSRETVLIVKTANEIAALVGGDTPVGVSRKSLLYALTKAKIGDLKASAGL